MTALADAIVVIGFALTVARSGGGSLEGPGRTPAAGSEMITCVSPDREPSDLTLLTLCDQR